MPSPPRWHGGGVGPAGRGPSGPDAPVRGADTRGECLLKQNKSEEELKELRVRVDARYHMKLHAMKLLKGRSMSRVVEDALDRYFENVEVPSLEDELLGPSDQRDRGS